MFKRIGLTLLCATLHCMATEVLHPVLPPATNINIETNQTSTSETTTEVKESSEENVLDDTVQESAVVEENNDNNKETE